MFGMTKSPRPVGLFHGTGLVDRRCDEKDDVRSTSKCKVMVAGIEWCRDRRDDAHGIGRGGRIVRAFRATDHRVCTVIVYRHDCGGRSLWL